MLLVEGWRAREKAKTARPPVRGLRSENARQGAAAPLSAMPVGLVVGQEGRQIGRCDVDLVGFGAPVAGVDVSGCAGLTIRGSLVVAIGHAGRQPRGGTVARRLVEADAGGAFRRIEGGFERRRERRFLVVGVIARPAIAEDVPADREAVRLLHAAPVIGGGRPPVIGERDRKPPAGGFR